jgi:hypothetical protein
LVGESFFDEAAGEVNFFGDGFGGPSGEAVVGEDAADEAAVADFVAMGEGVSPVGEVEEEGLGVGVEGGFEAEAVEIGEDVFAVVNEKAVVGEAYAGPGVVGGSHVLAVSFLS